jgi:hypothetical protein
MEKYESADYQIFKRRQATTEEKEENSIKIR